MDPDLLAKWDTIMKRIDNMFLKSKHALDSLHRTENYREYPHEQRGSFQQYQRRDEQYHVDRYLNSIQMDVPTFDGCLDYSDRSSSQKFLDWLQCMDRYFTRYLLSEAEKVSFATMKLTGQASRYRSALETLRELRGEYPIETWHDMKAHLNQKYHCTHRITELKKAKIMVQHSDAPKLGYTFRSQNHQVPTFKSTSYQYSHQGNTHTSI